MLIAFSANAISIEDTNEDDSIRKSMTKQEEQGADEGFISNQADKSIILSKRF